MRKKYHNTLTKVLDNVGTYLNEGHRRGTFSPEAMEKHRAANCFGRQAIIGSVLSDSLPDMEISLFITQSHGQPFEGRDGRQARWLGHAGSILTVDGKRYLLDTPPPLTTVAHPDLRSLDELSETANKRVIELPGHNVSRFSDCPPEDLQRLFGPQHISSLNHRFNVYPFEQGLVEYQSNIITPTNFTPQDYRDFYHKTVV